MFTRRTAVDPLSGKTRQTFRDALVVEEEGYLRTRETGMLRENVSKTLSGPVRTAEGREGRL
jgi:hypothetical protein